MWSASDCRLDNVSAEIIGVLPKSFYRNTAIWVPLKMSSEWPAMRGTGAATYGRLRRE